MARPDDHAQTPRGTGRVALMRERLFLLDTTLRDGAQTTGIGRSIQPWEAR